MVISNGIFVCHVVCVCVCLSSGTNARRAIPFFMKTREKELTVIEAQHRQAMASRKTARMFHWVGQLYREQQARWLRVVFLAWRSVTAAAKQCLLFARFAARPEKDREIEVAMMKTCFLLWYVSRSNHINRTSSSPLSLSVSLHLLSIVFSGLFCSDNVIFQFVVQEELDFQTVDEKTISFARSRRSREQ